MFIIIIIIKNECHSNIIVDRLKGCLYVVPFLRYSALNNGVTVKPGVGVV